MNDMKSPLLFMVFNRPDTTTKVFEEIRKARPSQLFIAGDGPRSNRPEEEDLCKKTREVTENVDWPCKVYRKYEENNLGCKIGVTKAINWFFDHVERGIILEDDCIPDPSFFSYCDNLLERYKNTKKVMMISGDNFTGKKEGDASYFFSRYCHLWGWATWKRAWKHYDVDMKDYPEFKRRGKIAEIFKNPKMQKHWLNSFDRLYAKQVDTWDPQWVYKIYERDGLCITPAVNMISNVGFGQEATHTKKDSTYSKRKIYSLNNIIHPSTIKISKKIDKAEEKEIFPTITTRVARKIKRTLFK